MVGEGSGMTVGGGCRCQNRRILGRGSQDMDLRSMGNKEHRDSVYPGSGPLEEVKPYIMLDCIDVFV